MRVHFTKEQLEYIKKKTGCDDHNQAIDVLANILMSEGVDLVKLPVYLNKLMERDSGP